jgi:hypothetical protein
MINTVLPLGVGCQQIDDLDAGDQDLRFGRLVGEFRRLPMDRQGHLGVDRAAFVDRLADHVDDTPKRLRAYRHLNGATGIGDRLAADKALARVHRDGAHDALAQVLRDLEHQALAFVLGLQRV